jgi:hypothetical protein
MTEISVGIYRFRDEDALHAALASAEAAAVMADVPRITDATVSRSVGTRSDLGGVAWVYTTANGTRRPTSFLQLKSKHDGILSSQSTRCRRHPVAANCLAEIPTEVRTGLPQQRGHKLQEKQRGKRSARFRSSLQGAA